MPLLANTVAPPQLYVGHVDHVGDQPRPSPLGVVRVGLVHDVWVVYVLVGEDGPAEAVVHDLVVFAVVLVSMVDKVAVTLKLF